MKPLSDIDRALTLIVQRRYKSALRAAKSAQKQDPKSPMPVNVSGIARASLGDHQAALACFSRALKLDPGFTDARRNLAQSLILLGRHDTAQIQLDILVKHAPDDAGAWYLLAQSQLATGRVDLAEISASHAIDAAPKQARAYNLRGLVRDRAGDFGGAIGDFHTALDLHPDNVETLVNISQPLARQNRSDDALAVLHRAVAIAPTHAVAWLRLAMYYLQSGDTHAAIATFRNLLDQYPNHAEAIEQLAQLQSPEQAPELAGLARAAMAKTPKRSEPTASLQFALSHIAEKSGDAQAARTNREAANRTMAQLLPYHPQADTALTDRLIARFPTPLPALDSVAPGTRPIYVLGLPRSGTTLAEAILGAHPQIAPLGERAAAGSLLQHTINADLPFDGATITRFVNDDQKLLPTLPAHSRAYVDKMPENYRLIGFLKSAYPHARIINIHRDPRDIALSMWKGHFSGTALNYTYDLGAMAHRFNLYARLMAHWRRILPGQILDVDYADMVTDVEKTGRRMATFCGLDWHAHMARPHETARQVLTLSAVQLRQPVHTRSIGTWRRHQDELAPLIAGLDAVLWPQLPD